MKGFRARTSLLNMSNDRLQVIYKVEIDARAIGRPYVARVRFEVGYPRAVVPWRAFSSNWVATLRNR